MQSQLKKSVSGFDIGQNKSIGAFFASQRAKESGENPNFFPTEQMTGQEYVDRLLKQQEDRY